MSISFEWMNGSAANFGYVDGSDIRIERYSKPDKPLYFYLSTPEKHYFYHGGPFYTPQDRDDAVLKELKTIIGT